MAFIAFEGIDGAGKSTLISGFAEFLKKQSKPYILTREPGGTPLAEKIRKLLIDQHEDVMVAKCEALLMQASRAQHTDGVIRAVFIVDHC